MPVFRRFQAQQRTLFYLFEIKYLFMLSLVEKCGIMKYTFKKEAIMEDIKLIIAKNITDLRKKHGITQAELAEKLNYTDKAVSKWERGASVPDIAVLKDIAVLFSVTIDYLTEEEHNEPLPPPPVVTDKRRMRNFGFITGMSILLVVLIATFIFVSISFFSPHTPFRWIPFLYAVPVSMIVWLIHFHQITSPINGVLLPHQEAVVKYHFHQYNLFVPVKQLNVYANKTKIISADSDSCADP
ncbi:MAG: helix-turn-helix transcriptional regulator, partial [Ruminococcus sp.]|nr:helix-turn-helix transcriptional regulator [Ruminococcus sp.]